MAIRKDRTELFVGLFVFFGLAIMGALIVQFGRFDDRLREKYELTVTFPDASGIREGSPVNLAGQKVGFVKEEPELNTDFTGVTVVLNIFGNTRIPKGSRFSIGTSGLMGDTYVKIQMPEDPRPDYLEPGSEVAGGETTGLEALQDDAGDVLAEINVAVRKIQTAVESLNRVFDRIEKGLLADENLENLKVTFAEFRKTAENLDAATAKIDPIMEEAKLAVKEAKGAMGKAGSTFDRAREVIGKAEPAMENLEPTLADLRSTLKTAREAIDRVTEGEGAAAAIISDSGLRADLESFADKLNRYGILGYPKEKKKAGSGGSKGLFDKLFGEE